MDILYDEERYDELGDAIWVSASLLAVVLVFVTIVFSAAHVFHRFGLLVPKES